MVSEENLVVPCKNFQKGKGCACEVWCNFGDCDCCVLCCKRHQCLDVCPIAQKLLKKPEWKGKHYSWESNQCENCGIPHETGSQIWFECPVDGRWMTSMDRCRFIGKNK